MKQQEKTKNRKINRKVGKIEHKTNQSKKEPTNNKKIQHEK